MKRQMQKGFTLIELMIVVAIIAILAAIAIPAYSDYTIKAKTGSALASLASIKTNVALCLTENGMSADSCDTTATGAVTEIPAWTATDVLSAVTVENGVITATFASGVGSNESGKKFTLTPSTTTGQAAIRWTGTNIDIVSGSPAIALITGS